MYDFDLKNNLAKANIAQKLKDLLTITSNLKVKVQMKIKIVKQYILGQIRFELKTYNFGATWIDENLDAMLVKYVRDWLEMPISSCIKEMMTLPVHKGGLGIPLLKNVSDQMWLQKRNALKHSSNSDIKQVWSDTSYKHISSDSLLTTDNLTTASITLKKSQMSKAKNHFYALEVQGMAARTVSDTVSKSNILLWTSNLESVSSYLHNFAKKALQQQLATLSNLVRWKKVTDASCPLCGTGAAQAISTYFQTVHRL